MKRIMTTTAAALVLATGAFAQADDMTDGGALGAPEFEATDMLASELMGQRLYSTGNELPAEGDTVAMGDTEWENIGEINEIVLNPEGEVQAAIVGVGGFLGIGEKNVAISMDMISRYDGEDGQEFMVIQASREELEAAPAFEGLEQDESAAEASADADAQMDDGSTEAGTEMAEGDMSEGDMTDEASGESTEMAEGESTEDAATGTEMAEGDMSEGDMTDEATGDGTEMADAEAPDASGPGAPAVTMDGYETRDVSELTADDVTGANVYGVDDTNIGEVNDLVITEDGSIEQAVLDVGGFLGIGEKRVALSFDKVQILADAGMADVRLYVDYSEDELRDMQEWSE